MKFTLIYFMMIVAGIYGCKTAAHNTVCENIPSVPTNLPATILNPKMYCKRNNYIIS